MPRSIPLKSKLKKKLENRDQRMESLKRNLAAADWPVF